MELELLSPAKNYEYGVAAVNCGADALYIGASSFSARSAAHNNIEDIKRLVDYAHLFNVKVYVALNTILFDDELEEAERVAIEVCNAGVDALIVQDMAYAMMDLPNIELFASTQMSNTTIERVQFLKEAGFSRVILERGLTLSEIEYMHEKVDIPLESFVHGAICVSNSGECYMSHVVSGRSGNRGECSQPCRSRFNLIDSEGNMVLRDKHLLSLLDMNFSHRLEDLINVGISSFKIEGRLKDLAYLRNNVTYYNKALNKVRGHKRSSLGHSYVSFNGDPLRTFSRGFTDYFLDGKREGVASFDTAKSVGTYIGKVEKVSQRSFTLSSIQQELNNGDGVMFVSELGTVIGTNINTVEGVNVFANKMEGIAKGQKVYRNFDKKAIDIFESAKAERKINANITLSFNEQLTISIIDETGCKCAITVNDTFDTPKSEEMAIENIKKQFSKSGDTIFTVKTVTINGDVKFIPSSRLNALRRELLDTLTQQRLSQYVRNESEGVRPAPLTETVTYKYNVCNSLSRKFYELCGCEDIEEGVELKSDFNGLEVMTSSYCLRREIGRCTKETNENDKLIIENNRNIFELSFDCKKCQMKIVYQGKQIV